MKKYDYNRWPLVESRESRGDKIYKIVFLVCLFMIPMAIGAAVIIKLMYR